MKHEDIVDMAKEAGLETDQGFSESIFYFAKLVAAKEREACAETCLKVVASHEMKKFMGDAAHYAACTAAIRARDEV